MELPVIGGRGTATSDTIVRAIRKSGVELTRVVAAEEETIDGGVAFMEPASRSVAEANCVRDVHIPAGESPAAIMGAIANRFAASAAHCCMLVPTESRLDEEWRPALRQNGFDMRLHAVLLMTSASEPGSCPPRFQVVSARAVAPAYRNFLSEWFSSRGIAPEPARQLAACEAGFLDADAMDVIVARHNGAIVGAVGAFAVAEFGIIRGLRVCANAAPATIEVLLSQLLDLCKRSQFRQVAAAVNPSDRSTVDALMRIGMTRIADIECYIRPGCEVCE